MRDFLAAWLRDSIRKGIKTIRGGQPLKYLSTNDMDKDGKLKPGYIADRLQEKKKRERKNA